MFNYKYFDDLSIELIDGDRGKNYPKNDEMLEKGYCLFLNAKNVTLNGFVFDENVFITKEKDEILRKGKLNRNDIVLTTRGTIGNVGLYDDKITYDNVRINSGMLIIRNNDNNINTKYLYYQLTSPFIRNQIFSLKTGSAQPQIPITVLKKLKLIIPDKRIQDKIVRVMDSIINKLTLNNEINNNLHDLAEQQFNEIYLKGSPKKLGELLVNISTGSRPKGGAQDCGVPSIGAEKIEKFGVYNYSSEKYISEEYYEKLKNGKLNSGDVLLYKDGAYTGKVSMCLNDFPHKKAAVNEHVFILNTKNNWAQNYLYFTLYNKDNKEMIHRLACSKAAQPGLNQIELKSIEVNICDEKEIINFENSVKPIMEKISSNTLENKKLVELRDTLLPKLMNGEIDLDNIEI